MRIVRIVVGVAEAVAPGVGSRQLESMLKDSPKAIESMRADPEERVAYAFQFWAAGMLDVGTKPTTFFEKVQSFMRKVLGAVRDTDKALAIFQAFTAASSPSRAQQVSPSPR